MLSLVHEIMTVSPARRHDAGVELSWGKGRGFSFTDGAQVTHDALEFSRRPVRGMRVRVGVTC
jgi:hypothetical protein